MNDETIPKSMASRKDGLDGCGAQPGDTVRCIRKRDEQGRGTFQVGEEYACGTAPNGDLCIWHASRPIGSAAPSAPLPYRGFGFYFEVVK